LEKAVELNPNQTSAYFLIANVHAAQKKYDMAIAQYEKIAAKNPKAIPPTMMIGVLYDRKNEPQKANEYYKKVLDINKSAALAANNLAWNYAQQGGNLDVALGLAQKARESNPNDPFIADTLGWINYKKGGYLTAISFLKESDEKFKSKNPEVSYHLGMAYLKNGDKALAADNLKRALASERTFNGRDDAKKALDDMTAKRG
jgi:tetratricopeptide (TPR) repeat protein